MNIYCDETIFESIASGTPEKEDSLKIVEMVKIGTLRGWVSSATKYNSVAASKPQPIKGIFDGFAEVPLRRSVTDAVLAATGDTAAMLHSLSAKQFHIPYLVTVDKKRYALICDAKVVDPAEVIRLATKNIGLSTIVPFLDLKAQHYQIYNEIDDRITDIIANTGFILGKYVEELEQEFAKLHHVKYCLAVSTGTDALHIAMLALGIGQGDRVAIPTNTFIATAEGVSLVGAIPVFVDCDEYYNIDTKKLEALIFSDNRSGIPPLKAVIPVHLYGQPANMIEIQRIARLYGIAVVEDACQAHCASFRGTPVGGFSSLTAFSFYPGKNLGAYGEAGALITNDEQLYQIAKMYRQHGEITRYHHQIAGHNYRMEAIQGAVLGVKIKYVREWTALRQKHAQLYNSLLASNPKVQTPKVLQEAEHVYHLYIIQAQQRDELKAFLEKKGIATALHYPIPLHMQEAYRYLGYKEGDCPIAEAAAQRILSLPMFPELRDDEIAYVCDTINIFYAKS